MVRIHPDPPLRESARVQGRAVRRKGGPDGAVAQLGERLLCKQEVVGSIPSGSTKHHLSIAVAKQRSTLVPRARGQRRELHRSLTIWKARRPWA